MWNRPGTKCGRVLICLCWMTLMVWQHSGAEGSLGSPFDMSRMTGPQQNEITDPLNDVLSALERALLFLYHHIDRVNLDALIGPREVEGVSNALLVRYWENMPTGLVNRLMRLRQLASDVGELGKHVVQEETPYYYTRARHLIQPYSWSLYRSPDKLNYSQSWFPTGKTDAWEEENSDNCLHELLNKTEDGRCAISYDCWRTVSSNEQSGYSLVHQLIYLLTGLNSGCLDDLEQLSVATAPDISLGQRLRMLCTRIFIEAEELASSDFPLEDRDLFMEQIGMCGQAGFVDQTQLSWLQSILSWQSPNGCFHKFKQEYLAPSNFDPQGYGTYRRRKRVEKYMSVNHDGPEPCLAHRTSVALSALNSFLIRLVEQRHGLGRVRTDDRDK